jgi:hypothetical protein
MEFSVKGLYTLQFLSQQKIMSANPLITTALSLISGVFSAFITTKIAEQTKQKEQQEKRKEKVRISYLNPLYIACDEFLDRLRYIEEILQKSDDAAQKDIASFKFIKNYDRTNNKQFYKWCNGEGYFAISSLYITVIYLCKASRIRSELPFVGLSSDNDKKLLEHLAEVRQSLGRRYGIWEVNQDSLGSYVTKADGKIMNYREFCELIVDEHSSIWFLTLFDFYSDISKKKDYEVKATIASLEKLKKFLEGVYRKKSSIEGKSNIWKKIARGTDGGSRE